ncbi:MAG TPA: hypothetical protein VHV47_08435 [Opitutaceae bacterium]|jgi:hypothetical protein|nr:hypothetical protein [Opitutaceae bacterium]
MKSSFFRLSFLAAAALGATGAQAAFNPAVVSGDARWVIYADLDALRTSAVGKQLIDAAVKAQTGRGLPVQFDVPKVLATIGSVTAYGSNFDKDPKRVDGTAVFQGTADLPKIVEALLIQSTLTTPAVVTEVKDLGFSAYSFTDARKDAAGVIIAFPPGGAVLVSKSEDQLRRAAALLAGGGNSLAKASDSALRGLIGNAAGATFFAATVMPPDSAFPANAPQMRILHMTNSASVALGEQGDKTFAHVVLAASNGDMADKLEKILQGMTAMMSLAQSNDQQITDFINSAQVVREGESVSLHLTYSSAKLAEMIQRMAARAPAVVARTLARNDTGALERLLGRKVFSWSTANVTASAGAVAAAPAPEWHQAPDAISLANGAQISIRILASNSESPARFEELELTPAGGGTPLVFSRRLVAILRSPQGTGRVLQLGFPGEEGKYTLRVRVQAAVNTETNCEIWVKDPVDSAAAPVQQP